MVPASAKKSQAPQHCFEDSNEIKRIPFSKKNSSWIPNLNQVCQISGIYWLIYWLIKENLTFQFTHTAANILFQIIHPPSLCLKSFTHHHCVSNHFSIIIVFQIMHSASWYFQIMHPYSIIIGLQIIHPPSLCFKSCTHSHWVTNHSPTIMVCSNRSATIIVFKIMHPSSLCLKSFTHYHCVSNHSPIIIVFQIIPLNHYVLNHSPIIIVFQIIHPLSLCF